MSHLLAAPLPRRGALAAGGAFALACAPQPARAMMSPSDERKDWETFKRRFVDPTGRVIDTGNNGCSHTEGQGWAMLFAVAFDDPETFDLILTWTERHLRRSYDSLHSWRYQPNAPVPVADPNNATDGDVSIAAALWRAARRWGRPDHARLATAIARDILASLVVKAGPRTVLLPGIEGFTFRDSVTVNPSYYAFPMLDELAEAAPSPIWTRLIEDGRALIDDGRFGLWRLPPDWLRVSRLDGGLAPHPHWPARFSWDAIRVPLWLAWGRREARASEAFTTFWQAGHPAPPAWVDLATNATAPYAAPAGMLAIGCLAVACRRPPSGSATPLGFPAVQAASDYYSSALILLSRLAWRESQVA